MEKKIFLKLKTKAASFGFNKDELQGIAATIADNLDSEKATDEDIDAQIEAVIPFLKAGQQHADRLVSASAKTVKTTDDDDDDVSSATAKKTNEKNDGEPEWFRKYREQQDARLAMLEAEKTTSGRRAKLEALLKDSGKFGERTLKNFTRMKFDKDDDFDEFISDVESDLEALKQDEGNEAVNSVTKPPGGSDGKPKKEKPLTDDEIKDIVAGIN